MTGNAFTAFRQFCADFVYHFVTSDCTHGLSDSFFLFLRFFRRHWPFDDTLGERRPLHQFQHEKTNAADAPGVKRRSDLNDHTLHAKATWLRTSVAARWRDRVGMGRLWSSRWRARGKRRLEPAHWPPRRLRCAPAGYRGFLSCQRRSGHRSGVPDDCKREHRRCVARFRPRFPCGTRHRRKVSTGSVANPCGDFDRLRR